MAVELSGTTQSKKKSNTNGNQEFKFPQKVHSFKDEQVIAIFHLLHKSNKLKLPEARRPNEVGHITDPNYCLFHRMVHHPISRCYVFKDKIQSLVDAAVLTLKSEQKKVTANMVTLNFGTFPKMTVQDGLDLINPMAEQQKAKGLIPLTTESGEIMWVHPDIVKDEQWETNKPKGKSCNVISLAADDDSVVVASLSNSKGEKPALAAQPSTSQPVGTRSGKQYLR